MAAAPRTPAMASSRSSPSPPPAQSLSAGGGAHISLFLDSNLGTHLVVSVAADSTIGGLKAQVAVEHAAAFPDLGPVLVKSFQVLRKGAMYHLSDSMAVRSAFSKVRAQCFLHVNMEAAETDTHHCRDEDEGRSSDVLPPMLKGGEDDGAWVTVHAHDVHPLSLSQRNKERKSTPVCLTTDVRTISVPVIDKSKSYKHGEKHRDQIEGVYVNSTSVTLVGKEVDTREEDLLHSVEDHELGIVSGNNRIVIREEKFGELHAMADLSEEKDCKKARVTGSFDTSVMDPIRETNDSKTRDVENLDKHPLETSTNSHRVLSSTSSQQGGDGNVKEDSIKLENPIITRKNRKRKKIQSVTSKGVCAQELTEPSTGAVEVPKDTGEDPLHENQGLQGDGASNVEMTSRDKTRVIPPDMLLSSSQQNSGSQVTKYVQLGTDAQATSDLAADPRVWNRIYPHAIMGVVNMFAGKYVPNEEISAEGTNDLYHDESAVDASNMEKGSKREDVLETIDDTSQEKNCKQSNMVSSVGLTCMDAAEAKDQCGHGKKAGESEIISILREIAKDPYKRQIKSYGQQGDCNVIENPNGDVEWKKKRRQDPESSKDDPTQAAAKSSGLITNAGLTQNTSSHCPDANQITLGNIGEETADEKDQGMREKAAELVIVSTQVVSVHDPSNVKQGDSDVIKNPNGDGKRKKKKRRHLESSKDDLTQDVTKSSGLITNGSSIQNTCADPLNSERTTTVTIGEATVSDCWKVDETVDAATANVITEVSAYLRCTDDSGQVLNGDPLMEQTKHCASAALSPLAVQSDAPISSPSTKSLGDQARHVPVEDLKGENCNKAGFMNSRAQQGAVIPEGSSDAVEPNDYVAVHPDNDNINFIDHFSPSAMNGPPDSAIKDGKNIREVKDRNKSKRKADTLSRHAGSIEPNDLPESHVYTDKTRLADHFGTGNVGMPSVSEQNMNRGDVNVKKGKKKSKRKSDLVKPESIQTNGGNQDTDNCPQDLMHSDVQLKGRVEQGNAKENNDKVIQNDSMLQQETEDATRDSTLEKKPHQSMSGADSQTNLPVVKDYAHMSKKQRNSTSHTKCHTKSRNHDGSVDERTSTNPNAVSNLVQSISMSPQAWNESAYGTPAVNQFRVAVRKIRRKKHDQRKDKSKEDISNRETGTIFGDTIRKTSQEVLNAMSEKAAKGNSSSTSADSGI